MALRFSSGGIESRFEAYGEALAASLGHADRAAPFRSYCAGLILPGDRKSVEPMAARVEPGRVQAARQSLHRMVAKAEWPDQAVLASIRNQVLPKIVQAGATLAWIIDDTGFPKKVFIRSVHVLDHAAAQGAYLSHRGFPFQGCGEAPEPWQTNKPRVQIEPRLPRQRFSPISKQPIWVLTDHDG